VAAFEASDSVPARWGEASDPGSDPVSAAWAISTSPWAVGRLLQQIRSTESERAGAAWKASASEPGHPPVDVSEACGHCADAIRAAIARPPAVADLVAASEERRAEAERAWALGEDPVAMIEAATRAGVAPRLVGRAACACVRRAIERTLLADPRSRRALTIAERWALGEDVTRPELYNAATRAREVPATLPEDRARALCALAVVAAVAIADTALHSGSAPLPSTCGHAVDMAMNAIEAVMRAQAEDRPARAAATECAHIVRTTIGELLRPDGRRMGATAAAAPGRA
jgi:hypothetical protein